MECPGGSTMCPAKNDLFFSVFLNFLSVFQIIQLWSFCSLKSCFWPFLVFASKLKKVFGSPQVEMNAFFSEIYGTHFVTVTYLGRKATVWYQIFRERRVHPSISSHLTLCIPTLNCIPKKYSDHSVIRASIERQKKATFEKCILIRFRWICI